MSDVNDKRRLQVGGTLNPQRHVYIERPSDTELLQRLRNGTFCTVVASRQMGKSSLLVRTATMLRAEGALVAIVDMAGEVGYF